MATFWALFTLTPGGFSLVQQNKKKGIFLK